MSTTRNSKTRDAPPRASLDAPSNRAPIKRPIVYLDEALNDDEDDQVAPLPTSPAQQRLFAWQPKRANNAPSVAGERQEKAATIAGSPTRVLDDVRNTMHGKLFYLFIFSKQLALLRFARTGYAATRLTNAGNKRFTLDAESANANAH